MILTSDFVPDHLIICVVTLAGGRAKHVVDRGRGYGMAASSVLLARRGVDQQMGGLVSYHGSPARHP